MYGARLLWWPVYGQWLARDANVLHNGAVRCVLMPGDSCDVVRYGLRLFIGRWVMSDLRILDGNRFSSEIAWMVPSVALFCGEFRLNSFCFLGFDVLDFVEV